MRISVNWRNLWPLVVALAILGAILSQFELPWWVSISVGGVVGGFWPTSAFRFEDR